MKTTGDESPAVKPKVFRAMVQSRSLVWVLGFVFSGMFLFIPVTLLVPLLVPAWGAIPVLVAVAMFLGLVGAVFVEAMSRVTVGTDGVLIRRRFGEQFLAFSDIADVAEVDGVAIRFYLTHGGWVDLYTGKDEQVAKPKYVRTCEELVERIRQGIEAHRERAAGGQANGASMLRERAHRSLRGEVRVERVPYRAVPAPTTQELTQLAEAEASPPSTRAAAAVLLRQENDAAAKARLRIASEVTADPELRRLFRVAAADEVADHELEEAFDAVERAVHTRRGRVRDA